MTALTQDDCASFRYSPFTDVLAPNPELAALAMRIIGVWSVVEMLRLGLFAQTLRSDRETALSIFGAVNDASRNKIMTEVIDRKLASDSALFKKALASTDASKKVRHALAHWVWGTSATSPESLVACNPNHFDEKAGHGIGTLVAVPNDETAARKFSKADLEHELEEAYRARKVMYDLRNLANYLGYLQTPRGGSSGYAAEEVDSIRKRLIADKRNVP
jgi:hypothetical protein